MSPFGRPTCLATPHCSALLRRIHDPSVALYTRMKGFYAYNLPSNYGDFNPGLIDEGHKGGTVQVAGKEPAGLHGVQSPGAAVKGRTRLTAGLAALAFFASQSPSPGAVLATQAEPTGFSSYGGISVWSELRGERFVLVAREAGVTRRLPGIPSRRIPFDADLGPTSRGPAAVYSRCDREPARYGNTAIGLLPDYTSGRGCRIFSYLFSDERERQVRAGGRSATLPTVWGRWLVFVEARRKSAPVFRVRFSGRGRPRRVGSGVRVPPYLGSMDLRAGRLATIRIRYVRRCSPSAGEDPFAAVRSSVAVQNIRTGDIALLERTCSGPDDPSLFFGVRWLGRQVGYAAKYARDPRRQGEAVRRFDPLDQTVEETGVFTLLTGFDGNHVVTGRQLDYGGFVHEVIQSPLRFAPVSRLMTDRSG